MSMISSSIVESNLSHRSTFHQKQQKSLIDYLSKQFCFSEELSTVIIYIHNCTDISQTLNLFLLNDNHKYQHIFIPSTYGQCQICGEKSDSHVFEYDEQAIEAINQAKKRYKQQKEQDDFFEEQQYVDFEEPLPIIKKPSKKSSMKDEKMVNCQLCYVEHGQSSMVHIKQTLHNVCSYCMNSYLLEEIRNLRIETLHCPHCWEPLPRQTIKSFVNNVTFEKYQTFLRNLQIQKNPNLRWCPKPQCSVVINFKSGKNTIKCPECSTLICTKCNREAHPKQSCDSVMKKQLQGLQNAKDIQKCKKCQALVQKISGCNHMTCTVCYYEWCWLCGSTYSDYHFSPLNPFGCAGLQDQHHNSWGKCKIYGLRVLLLLLFTILVPILLPIAMVFCGPVILISYSWRECRIDRKNICTKLVALLMFIVVGFIVDPFIWIGALVWSIPKLCQFLCQWVQRRRQIHEYSENSLKNKLLMENQVRLAEQL